MKILILLLILFHFENKLAKIFNSGSFYRNILAVLIFRSIIIIIIENLLKFRRCIKWLKLVVVFDEANNLVSENVEEENTVRSGRALIFRNIIIIEFLLNF